MPRPATLVPPPPTQPGRSDIENVLQLTPLLNIGPDIFSNTRPLWHPPGARGIYGGAVIAQCLAAAQITVPSDFLIHSMHCYFVLAGDASIPILYHVERVREGKSFMTRTVQARQRGRCIFTTTTSFMLEKSGGEKTVAHEWGMPEGPIAELDKLLKEGGPEGKDEAYGEQEQGPFISMRLGIANGQSKNPHEKRTRGWIKARGKISKEGGHQAHLSALAYMSDSYFVGTISRVHNLWRYTSPKDLPIDKQLKLLGNKEQKDSKEAQEANAIAHKAFEQLARKEAEENGYREGDSRPQVGMMVSLDHTIYFHRPRDFRADEWMLSEMESPWTGDGRGLITQRLWSRKGRLVATCVQEGLVRLKQDAPSGTKRESKL